MKREEHRLKQLAIALNLSVIQLEKQLGVKGSRVSNTIKRESDIKSDLADIIVDVFPHVNRIWLLTGVGDIFITTDASMGSRLKQIRNKFKLNSRQFALSIEMDDSQYLKVERGELGLTDKYLKTISGLYDINLHWLLTGEGPMDKTTMLKEPDTQYLSVAGIKRSILRIISNVTNPYASEMAEMTKLFERLEKLEKEADEKGL